MNLTQIKSTLKDNITPILFGSLILFVVLSIVSSVRTNKYQVTDLINYVETTTPYLLSQTTSIANGSLISKNMPESYDTNLTQLNDLKNYLVSRKTNIPKHPTEIKIENFVTLYTDFINHILDRVNAIIAQQQTIHDLNTSLEFLPDAITTIKQGTTSDIQSLGANAQTVYDRIEALKSDTPTYKYITMSYFSSYDSLIALAQDIATSLAGTDQISDELRDQLLTKISNKPPLTKVLFPAVPRYLIEDDAYLNYIKQLQDQIQTVKSTYSLK